ncbi:MAG: ferredoxin [Chloroflexi bacterium]|nr:ferredoxin [Chloroflexota bacterium]
MGQLEVSVDKERCVASQSCITIAPKAFALGSDGKSSARAPEAEKLETLREAAEMCPTSAIVVEEGESEDEMSE